MSVTHAIRDSGGSAHVDLLIGSLPLRLSGEDSALFSAAAKRYKGFTGGEEGRLEVSVARGQVSQGRKSEFSYDFEGARVEADAAGARFSGVRHEYALDSLLRMLLSWALLAENGFLLHAATVVKDGKAYVFVGRSGAGKSTVASLSPRGSVFTDEISLLKREGAEWRAYGTPFGGEFRADGVNTSAPLAGIFRLVQARENRVTRLRPSELLRAMLPSVLFFATEVGDHQRLLQILGMASEEVAGYTLEFRKSKSFWEVLP